MVETGVVPLLKTVLAWIAIPVTALIGFLGFHYKKLWAALENVRKENEVLHTKVAVNESQLRDLRGDIKELKYDIRILIDRIESRRNGSNS